MFGGIVMMCARPYISTSNGSIVPVSSLLEKGSNIYQSLFASTKLGCWHCLLSTTPLTGCCKARPKRNQSGYERNMKRNHNSIKKNTIIKRINITKCKSYVLVDKIDIPPLKLGRLKG